METYILYKGMLISRHEWFGGIVPSANILKQRNKLLIKGQIAVIDEEDFSKDILKKKIYRKQ